MDEEHEETPEPTPGLSVRQRAELLVLSQARGLPIISRFTEDELAELAELTTPEGRILPGAPVGFQKALAAYHERNKCSAETEDPGQ